MIAIYGHRRLAFVSSPWFSTTWVGLPRQIHNAAQTLLTRTVTPARHKDHFVLVGSGSLSLVGAPPNERDTATDRLDCRSFPLLLWKGNEPSCHFPFMSLLLLFSCIGSHVNNTVFVVRVIKCNSMTFQGQRSFKAEGNTSICFMFFRENRSHVAQ